MFGKPLAWLISGSLLALALVSCGKNVCFMGQGDCAQELTSTTLSLKSSASTVAVNAALTFTPSGGTKPYTYSTAAGTPGQFGNTTGDTLSWTAPSTAQTCCVRVTDASSNIADRCVTVQ